MVPLVAVRQIVRHSGQPVSPHLLSLISVRLTQLRGLSAKHKRPARHALRPETSHVAPGTKLSRSVDECFGVHTKRKENRAVSAAQRPGSRPFLVTDFAIRS